MSHGTDREQNMDDILQRLKSAVEQDGVPENDGTPARTGGKTAGSRISDRNLQQELKKRFLQDNAGGTEKSGTSEYQLDDEFLREAVASEGGETPAPAAPKKKAPKKTAPKPAASPEPAREAVPEAPGEAEEDDLPPWEVPAVHNEPEPAPEVVVEPEPVADVPVENEPAPKTPEPAPVAVAVAERPAPIESPETEDLEEPGTDEETEMPDVEPEESEGTEETGETEESEEPEEEPGFSEEPDEELPEPMPVNEGEDFGEREDPTVEEDFFDRILDQFTGGCEVGAQENLEEPTAPLTMKSADANGGEIPLSDEAPAAEEKPAQEAPIDPSEIDLLLQFGYRQEEIEQELGEECPAALENIRHEQEEELREEALGFDGEEYTSEKQAGRIAAGYRERLRRSRHRVFGVGAVALLLLFYELLPLCGVQFGGIFDPDTYPVAYRLFGLQFLVFAVLFCPAKIWSSLKNLVTLRPDTLSAAVLALPAVLIYDTAALFLPMGEELMSFHFLAALGIFSGLLADHMLLRRERTAFDIYTDAGKAYTLRTESGKQSFAERMYRGGLDRTQKVCVPASVDFPKNYFEAAGEKMRLPVWTKACGMVLPILSLLCGVVCILLGQGAGAALDAFITVYLSLLPFGYGFLLWGALCLSQHRLSKRGCAFAGSGAVADCARTNVVVFRDLHLFSECQAKDVGIAFYDETKALLTLGCLNTLYSAIGGPMRRVFADLPDEYRYEKMRILRILPNGIEAVVDERHLLIVGTPEFMKRYGFEFPTEDDSDRRRGRSVLCVSLDRRNAARLSVKYRVEPMFEALVERMAAERISVTVETYDPLINSHSVAALRKNGQAPISVFHKNVADLYRTQKADDGEEPTALIARGSRLKLAEMLVFAKCTMKGRLRASLALAACTLVGGTVAATLAILGVQNHVNQFFILLFYMLTDLLLLALTLGALPGKRDFIPPATRAPEPEATEDGGEANEKK